MSQSISRFPKTFKALLKVPNKQMPPALGIYRFLNKEEKYDENNILKESMVSINIVSMIFNMLNHLYFTTKLLKNIN